MTKTANRIKQTGEVFTPSPLVSEILDNLPPNLISDPSKTILDPSCGNGQFLIEVVKRRKSLINVFGVDIMADNVCDTIARLVFFNKHKVDIFDSNAQPIPKLEIDPHEDYHTYDWVKQQPSFERLYVYKKKLILVRTLEKSPTAVYFEYSTDDIKWFPFKQIACANSLNFDYAEFDNAT